ncbi:MAG: GTPase HflX [Bacillota bacterium]|nr:GTPase HflX [Bacillota bacterium]
MQEKGEKAWLLIRDDPVGGWAPEAEEGELKVLVETLGWEVVGTTRQRRQKPDPSTWLGPGKLKDVQPLLKERGANLAVTSEEITPGQRLHLRDLLGVEVVDRTQVVLEIFAQRARSREGKLQVELAQLRYLLPQLRGHGEELSRLGGGIGTRGPGETKLEVDRRRLRERIRQLEREIRELRERRQLVRLGRKRLGLPVVALVGYSNAGKTTLFNRLTGEDLPAQDRLFVTLDPAIRRLQLGEGRQALLSDTVGFIHDLPHHLVQAFHATLEEVTAADLILHVLDISRPGWEERQEAVEEVLVEIGAGSIPRLLALNQVDRLEGGLPPGAPGGVPISALTGKGLEDLQRAIADALDTGARPYRFRIPYEAGDLLAWIRQTSRVRGEAFTAEGVELEIYTREDVAEKIQGILWQRQKERAFGS